MISITDKHNCSGCTACVQCCPQQCISLYEDGEGFLYPNVDKSACINCSACEKVCPVINQGEARLPQRAYAAVNPDDCVRLKSSSGGVFSMLAEKVIDKRGVVFGVRFNDQWEVIHDYVETKEKINIFCGSKYVQSRIGESFIQVKRFLEQDRIVLFSGTPCQVAGLKLLLHKSYDNLYTVDVVCHGVPSPKLWREYLSKIIDTSEVKQISMKDKKESWRRYKMTICGEEKIFLSEYASHNKYLSAFSQNLSLRPSCYYCPAKAGKSGSDITLADYWGVEKFVPELDDDRGTSFVCANTDKGLQLIHSVSLNLREVDYKASVPFNPCIERSIQEPEARASFWQSYQNKGINVLYALESKKINKYKLLLRRIFH